LVATEDQQANCETSPKELKDGIAVYEKKSMPKSIAKA
jgi:hypothetical protein